MDARKDDRGELSQATIDVIRARVSERRCIVCGWRLYVYPNGKSDLYCGSHVRVCVVEGCLNVAYSTEDLFDVDTCYAHSQQPDPRHGIDQFQAEDR